MTSPMSSLARPEFDCKDLSMMHRIASPQDLVLQLRQLLAHSQEENPSRKVLAFELRTLARQTIRDIEVDWPDFQRTFVNDIGKLMWTGRKHGWEEVPADEMQKALRDAARAAGPFAMVGGKVGNLFKQMAGYFGQAAGLLRKGLGGPYVSDTLMGWKAKQFGQLVQEGLSNAAELRAAT